MFLKMDKVEWGRLLWHIPHGVLAAVLFAALVIALKIPNLSTQALVIICIASAAAGIAWTALIMCYQFIEDWRISD